MPRNPNDTIEISEDRRLSAPLKMWLAVIVAASVATFTYAALASGGKTIDDHEIRLKTIERALSKLEVMDAKIDFMRAMMIEEEKRERSRSLRVGP